MKDEAEFIYSGKVYLDNILNLINQSQERIFLVFYTFKIDLITKIILDSLERAAKRGVKIFIMCDSFGSIDLTENHLKVLLDVGVKFSFFNRLKLTKILTVGRRIHTKLITIDEQVSILGGVNLAEDYLRSEMPWLDFGVLLNEFHTKKALKLLSKELCQNFKFKKQDFIFETKFTENYLGKVVMNDWLNKIQSIRNGYIRAIISAREEIVIVSSYFFPSSSMLLSLIKASKKGVRVKLLFSQKLDIPFFKNAMESIYKVLVRNNIEIYEYENSILHGKLIIVDSKWISLGSFNLDHTSQYGNLELNFESKNLNLIKDAKNYIEQKLQESFKAINAKEVDSKGSFFTYYLYKFFTATAILYIKLSRAIKS